MTPSTIPAPARTPGRSRRLRAAIALVGVLAVGGVTASALWTDTAQVETTVTSGSFGINVDGQEGNPVPYVVDMGLGNALPGDTVTRTFVVNNTGSVAANLSMSGNSANGSTGLVQALTGEVSRAGTTLAASGPLRVVGFANQVVPAGGSVPITVKVTVPTNLSKSFQGTSDTFRMKFTAVQRP